MVKKQDLVKDFKQIEQVDEARPEESEGSASFSMSESKRRPVHPKEKSMMVDRNQRPGKRVGHTPKNKPIGLFRMHF